MKYRFVTAGAVVLAWVIIFQLNLTRNGFSFLIPVAVLALFQLGEKRIGKYFDRG
jgi:hypothetical protein